MNTRFSLQRVLELKQRREETLAVRLAAARAEAEAAREAEESIEALRYGGSRQPVGAGMMETVGQLQNTAYVLDQLDQKLDEARAMVRKADAKVNECFSEFREASRDRQALDRLKERKLEAAMLAEQDADRKTMDAIALTRFARGEPVAEGSKG